MSHRQSFTCLLRSKSLLWWNKLQNQVRSKAAHLMLPHVVFLRAFFFWRGILLKAQSTKSQTLSLIHSLYLVCTCGSCVRCLVFLLAERPHVPPHSIWGMFPPFSSQGMFTSAWLSRHPTSWCQGLRQEVCWHGTQANLRGEPYRRPSFGLQLRKWVVLFLCSTSCKKKKRGGAAVSCRCR